MFSDGTIIGSITAVLVEALGLNSIFTLFGDFFGDADFFLVNVAFRRGLTLDSDALTLSSESVSLLKRKYQLFYTYLKEGMLMFEKKESHTVGA